MEGGFGVARVRSWRGVLLDLAMELVARDAIAARRRRFEGEEMTGQTKAEDEKPETRNVGECKAEGERKKEVRESGQTGGGCSLWGGVESYQPTKAGGAGLEGGW